MVDRIHSRKKSVDIDVDSRTTKTNQSTVDTSIDRQSGHRLQKTVFIDPTHEGWEANQSF